MARTYEHLAGQRRRPTDYEIASTALLYYPQHGFGVRHRMADWYHRYQQQSPLRCDDWEQFADPHALTYADYTARRADAETFLTELRRTGDDPSALPAPWVAALDRFLAPMRFPVHGLQMLAAYIGHLAPSGRVVICSMFQAADELRRIHALAYRTGELRRAVEGFGADSRQRWQQDPLWQPLRRVIERLLVTWDFGEAFAAVNLAVKPVLDTLWTTEFGEVASGYRDDMLQRTLQSLARDCAWHQQWAAALTETLVAQRPANRDVLAGWIGRWAPEIDQACEAFAPVWPPGDFARAMVRARQARRTLLAGCGLEGADE